MDDSVARIDEGRLRLDLVDDSAPHGVRHRATETLARYEASAAGKDFWARSSLEELAVEQGTAPITDASLLVLEGISEEDWAAFAAALSPAGRRSR